MLEIKAKDADEKDNLTSLKGEIADPEYSAQQIMIGRSMLNMLEYIR